MVPSVPMASSLRSSYRTRTSFPVRLVGPLDLRDDLEVVFCQMLRKSVELVRCIEVTVLGSPAASFKCVKPGGYHVPGVPDQEDQTTIRGGLQEQRRPDGAVGLLDYQVLVISQVWIPDCSAFYDEIPY